MGGVSSQWGWCELADGGWGAEGEGGGTCLVGTRDEDADRTPRSKRCDAGESCPGLGVPP